MHRLALIGGWGYDNLGDEAILAGYRAFLHDASIPHTVLSISPRRTLEAQGDLERAHQESRVTCRVEDIPLVCGGGYLNGAWVPQVYWKLLAIGRNSQKKGAIVHAVELRAMDRGASRLLARRCLNSVDLSVRDLASSTAAENIFGHPEGHIEVLPDAISLGYGRLMRNSTPQDVSLASRVLVNLMDIRTRGDVSEAEIDVSSWIDYVNDILKATGDSAVGLIVGDDEARFMRRFPNVPLIRPRTVAQLVSTIAASAGLISVRMHPALIASQIGTPCVAVPYCGKVRPTHERIGIADQVLASADANETMSMLHTRAHHKSHWQSARLESEEWLIHKFDHRRAEVQGVK